jgi:isocitrate/isopropylmalate dehydrogenase
VPKTHVLTHAAEQLFGDVVTAPGATIAGGLGLAERAARSTAEAGDLIAERVSG